MRRIFTFFLALTVGAGTLFAVSDAEGALPGLFTINADDEQVVFSQGNLQATTTDLGANWAWSFAENQWDYVGKAVANTTIGSGSTVTKNGTVDLFCWSTGATYYGINKSTHGSDFGGNFKDWGEAIGGGWSTLSKDEWLYLFDSRTGDQASTVDGTADVRYVKATIHDIPGVILFPDGGTFAASEFTTLSSLNEATAAYDVTTCTDAQWAALETKGCVFLPAAGDRSGTNVYAVNYYGYYWSSTKYGTASAYFLKFAPDNLGKNWSDAYYGCSVRLVRALGPVIVDSGTCGGDTYNNLTWTLSTAGVLTISGTGAMANWESTLDIPWYKHRESILSVVIEEGVTSIGDAAFFNCKNLPTITIPQNIAHIGDNVFVGCNGLTSINVDKNNTNYSSSTDGVLFDKDQKTLMRFPAGKSGSYAYVIPNSVDSIGEYAFQNCTGMSSVTIPKNLKSIGWNGFDNCSGLTSITSNAVTPPDCGEGDDRFDKVDKDIPVNVPEGSVEAYKEAPGWSEFTNIRYHCIIDEGKCGYGDYYSKVTYELSCDGVLTIAGEGPMANYRTDEATNPVPWAKNKIKAVVIKSGVTTIGRCAFYGGDNIVSVEIPNTVTSIKEKAFGDCPVLATIEVAADNPNFSSVDGVLFNKDQTTLVQYALGNERTEYTVPNTVISIGERAFERTIHLTSVTLPETVKMIDSYAFADCHGLTSFEIPKSVTAIQAGAFKYCTHLTSINLPDGITSIEASTFYGCTALADVVLPNNVTSIGASAFWYCSGLTAIDIPDKVTTIGQEAFYDCDQLTSVTLPKNLSSIGDGAFKRCISLTDIVLPESITTISNSLFSGCSKLASVTIKGKITSIGEYAFGNCSKLIDFDIPATVNTIGGGAFANCAAFTTVTIPDSVQRIEESTFYQCKGLVSVTIPEKVTNIGKEAFYYCSGLEAIMCKAAEPPVCETDAFGNTDVEHMDVYVPEQSVETYKNTEPWSQFKYISAITAPSGTCEDNLSWNYANGILTVSGMGEMLCTGFWSPWSAYREFIKSVVIEGGITTVGTSAFSDYPALISVDLPKSLTSIGQNAFFWCDKLTTVTIPAGVTELGKNAFNGCKGLTSIISYAAEPPTCGANCFYNVDKSIPVLVPKGSLEKYQDEAAEGWKDFTNIQVNPIAASGFCGAEGKNLQWTLNIDSVLTISGEGAMADNVSSWIPYRSAIKSIVIEDEATSIGKEAFAECTNLIAVTIPSSVTSIGDAAFRNCSSLPSIALPNGITSISSYVFSGCAKLTEFIIPTSVTEIGNYAFAGCSGLTTITIPYKVTKIGEMAFSDCTGLTAITSRVVTPPDCGTDCFLNVDKSIPLNVPEESVEDYQHAKEWEAFTNMKGMACLIASGTFGESNQHTWELSCGGTLLVEGKGTIATEYPNEPWDEYALDIKSVIISEGATTIGGESFSNLDNLTSISLPQSLTNIEAGAFHSNNKLTTVTIPNNVTHIGSKAFAHCYELTTIILGYGLKEIDENAFGGHMLPPNSITCFAVTPPRGVVNSSTLSQSEAQTIPLYVPDMSVSKYKAKDCEWQKFNVLPLSVRPGTHVIASGTCGNNLTWQLDSNGELIISGTGDMDKWSKAGETAAPWAAYRSEILYVKINHGVTFIGDNAFNGCTEIQSITCYATTPPTCGTDCFLNVNKDLLLYVPKENVSDYKKANGWKEFTMEGVKCLLGSGFCVNNSKLTWELSCDGELLIEGTGRITPIGNSPYQWEWDEFASDIRSIVMGKGVTAIGSEAFSNLENLESVTISSTVTTIEKGAFSNCGKLASLYIPDKVRTIGENAFSNCHGIQYITFHGYTTIAANAFSGSIGSLMFITIFSDAVLKCEGQTFGNSKKEETENIPLYVPKNAVRKYKDNDVWKNFKVLKLGDRPDSHVVVSGTCGAQEDNLQWELDSNGELTISGTGDMDGWATPEPAAVGKRNILAENQPAPWNAYLSEILYIVIESGVTSVGDYAFYGCVNVQSITCYATTPPTCGQQVFGGIDTSIPLYVPEASIPAYQTANQWQDFLEIQAIEQDTEDIPTILTNDAQPATKILYKGHIYILRDGKIYDIHGTQVR